MPLLVTVSDDPLTIAIGDAAVRLTPTEGLGLAEQLARKSFDQIARHSLDRVLTGFDPDAPASEVGTA